MCKIYCLRCDVLFERLIVRLIRLGTDEFDTLPKGVLELPVLRTPGEVGRVIPGVGVVAPLPPPVLAAVPIGKRKKLEADEISPVPPFPPFVELPEVDRAPGAAAVAPLPPVPAPLLFALLKIRPLLLLDDPSATLPFPLACPALPPLLPEIALKCKGLLSSFESIDCCALLALS